MHVSIAAGPGNITVTLLPPTSANVSWQLINVTDSAAVCQNVSAHSDLATVTDLQCVNAPTDHETVNFERIISGLCPKTDYFFTVSINNSNCSIQQSSTFNINASKLKSYLVLQTIVTASCSTDQWSH